MIVDQDGPQLREPRQRILERRELWISRLGGAEEAAAVARAIWPNV